MRYYYFVDMGLNIYDIAWSLSELTPTIENEIYRVTLYKGKRVTESYLVTDSCDCYVERQDFMKVLNSRDERIEEILK